MQRSRPRLTLPGSGPDRHVIVPEDLPAPHSPRAYLVSDPLRAARGWRVPRAAPPGHRPAETPSDRSRRHTALRAVDGSRGTTRYTSRADWQDGTHCQFRMDRVYETQRIGRKLEREQLSCGWQRFARVRAETIKRAKVA